MVLRREKVHHSENEAVAVENLHGELFSVVGEERHRPAYTNTQFGDLDRGFFRKRNRSLQLQAFVCDHKRKPVPRGAFIDSPKISMATNSSGLHAGKSFMSLEFRQRRTRFLAQLVHFNNVV